MSTWPITDAVHQSILDREELAKIPRPINWDDMGSSAKDLWEERQLRSIRNSKRKA